MDQLDVTAQPIRQGLAGVRDQLRQPIYDSQTFTGTGVNLIDTYSFFQDVAGKNASETNQQQSSQLSSHVSFLVQGLRMEVNMNDVNVGFGVDENGYYMAMMSQYSSLSLVLTEKIFLKAPFPYVGGKFKVDGTESPVGLSAFSQHLGDEMAVPVMFDANTVMSIEPNQVFSLDWEVYTPSIQAERDSLSDADLQDSMIRVYAYLLGLRRRPVQ